MNRLKRKRSSFFFPIFIFALSACSSPTVQENRAKIQEVPDAQILKSADEALLRLPSKKLMRGELLKIGFSKKTPLASLEEDSSIRDFVQVIEFGNPNPQTYILVLKSPSTVLGERTLGYINPKLWIEWPGRKVDFIEAKKRSLQLPADRKTPYWVSEFEIEMHQTGIHRLLISTNNRIQNQNLEPGQGRWLAVGNMMGDLHIEIKSQGPSQ